MHWLINLMSLQLLNVTAVYALHILFKFKDDISLIHQFHSLKCKVYAICSSFSQKSCQYFLFFIKSYQRAPHQMFSKTHTTSTLVFVTVTLVVIGTWILAPYIGICGHDVIRNIYMIHFLRYLKFSALVLEETYILETYIL